MIAPVIDPALFDRSRSCNHFCLRALSLMAWSRHSRDALSEVSTKCHDETKPSVPVGGFTVRSLIRYFPVLCHSKGRISYLARQMTKLLGFPGVLQQLNL